MIGHPNGWPTVSRGKNGNIKMMHGVYLDAAGTSPHLKGKSAILRPSEQMGQILAQFDDTSLSEAFGWHSFASECFELDSLSAILV